MRRRRKRRRRGGCVYAHAALMKILSSRMVSLMSLLFRPLLRFFLFWNRIAKVSLERPLLRPTFTPILNRHGYDHRTRQLQRCCSPRASERRGDSVHWKNWWISAGLQIYVQALGNFRDSETPSRQFWNPIHYLSVTSGIWELGIKFFSHSRWHVSKWILCTEKTIAIRSMYRGIFQYRDVPVF